MIHKVKSRVYRIFKGSFRYTWLGSAGEKLFRRVQVLKYKKQREKELPTAEDLKKQRATRFSYAPMISIIVPLYCTPSEYLEELFESIQGQSYENWELCLSDGSGEPQLLKETLEKYLRDDRIKLLVSEQALNISTNTNRALTLATGEYIAFVDHDDKLAPDALYECVKAINQNPEAEVFYSDEDKVLANGKDYLQPYVKPDFDLFLLRSINYICHLFVVKAELLQRVGGLREEFDGAQDYDLILRCVELAKEVCHIPKNLYHWRIHPRSTAGNPKSKAYFSSAGARAVTEHYERVGIQGIATEGEYPGLYRTVFDWDKQPLISIIFLQEPKGIQKEAERTIQSVKSQSYKNIQWIESLVSYNEGAKEAKGEFLLFLNRRVTFLHTTGIQELLGVSMCPGVGAVCGRIYDEKGKVLYAGLEVDSLGNVSSTFSGRDSRDTGPFYSMVSTRSVDAVPVEGLMVRRESFERVRGFDETLRGLEIGRDFTRRLKEEGYLVLYHPYGELTLT